MIDILFFVDFEEGHVFPTLKMAQNFKENGYAVAYMGIADTMDIVSRAGFETHIILEKVYPRGSVSNTASKNSISPQTIKEHTTLLLEGELDELFERIQPQMIFTGFFLNFEALILEYRYSIRQAIVWPILPKLKNMDERAVDNFALKASLACLRRMFEVIDIDVRLAFVSYLKEQGVSFNSFEDIVAPLSKLLPIIPCPKELEINDRFVDDNAVYLGPGTRDTFLGSEVEIQSYLPHDAEKKIIYLSLGSQVKSYPKKADTIFRLAMEMMRTPFAASYHLVLAAGLHGAKYQAEELPGNVSVFEWVPQIKLLENATIAITHGGLGSVKECIYYGVPMVIVPMGRDQHDNGERVIHHKLGLVAEPENLTADILLKKIMEVISSPDVSEGMSKMKDVFHLRENEKPELALVKQIIQKVGI